jgi:hypothetical protein
MKRYYRTPAWSRLREQATARAGGLCEYCRWRPVANIHHRTYAHFGREPLEDLMAVCRICHRRIHRIGSTDGFAMHEGSLADLGDSGLGDAPLWRDYLAHGTKGGTVA